MHSHSFEAPARSRLPWVFAAVLLILAIVAVWLWLRAPGGPQGVAEGELMSANTPSAQSPRASESNSTSPQPQPDQTRAAPDSDAAAPFGGAAGLPPSPTEDQVSTESLLAQADEAFDAGDHFVALPLYKEVAVRLQVQLSETEDPAARERLQRQITDITRLVRDSEQGIRALAPEPDFSNRSPHRAPAPGEVRDFAILELGNFPYDDQAGGVPPDVLALDGATVRMTGYMLPAFQTDQIRTFTLVNDVYQCCFGQPPGVEHMINVVLPESKAVAFTYGEIQVTGTLRIEEERRDGYVVNLFTIEEVTSVRATGRS